MGGAARAGGRAGARARGWRRRGRLLPERRRGGAPAEPRAGGPPPLALAAVTDGPTWCHPWRRSLVRRCSSHPFPLVFVCGWRRAAGAGLLLLTNDNAWINKLTHPKYVAAARAKPRRPRARPRAVPARRGLSVGCYGRFFFFFVFHLAAGTDGAPVRYAVVHTVPCRNLLSPRCLPFHTRVCSSHPTTDTATPRRTWWTWRAVCRWPRPAC